MTEQQDLTKPIVDPILLLAEGTAKLPPCSTDIAPLDSLDEFDRTCTIDVRAKLPERDRRKFEKDLLAKQWMEMHLGESDASVIKKKQHTVLTKINDQWSSGPISVLHKALSHKLRVKVWVRNHTTIRSILTGFVAAFDKHLNLAMVDVDEAILKGTLPVKCPILREDLSDVKLTHNEEQYLAQANASIASEPNDSEKVDMINNDLLDDDDDDDGRTAEKKSTDNENRKELKSQGASNSGNVKTKQRTSSSSSSSQQRTRESKKKTSESCRQYASVSQRFIPQLFIRGEQIVMVAFADT